MIRIRLSENRGSGQDQYTSKPVGQFGGNSGQFGAVRRGGSGTG